jgi:hypothetical protein
MRFEGFDDLGRQHLLHLADEIVGPAYEDELLAILRDQMGEQLAQGRFVGVVLGCEQGDDCVESGDRYAKLLVLDAERFDDLMGFLLDASEPFYRFLGHVCLLFEEAERRSAVREWKTTAPESEGSGVDPVATAP